MRRDALKRRGFLAVWHAYVDESEPDRARDPGVYLLGAALLDAARQKGTGAGTLRMDHVPGPAEPLLWLPDVILGAVGRHRAGNSEHYEKLAHLVEMHTLDP